MPGSTSTVTGSGKRVSRWRLDLFRSLLEPTRWRFDVPASAVPGQTYARLRLTSYDTGGTLAPTGPADDGEVEDYAWAIGEAADRLTAALTRNDVITRPGRRRPADSTAPGGASTVR
jgi:hypothetical protein